MGIEPLTDLVFWVLALVVVSATVHFVGVVVGWQDVVFWLAVVDVSGAGGGGTIWRSCDNKEVKQVNSLFDEQQQ